MFPIILLFCNLINSEEIKKILALAPSSLIPASLILIMGATVCSEAATITDGEVILSKTSEF